MATIIRTQVAIIGAGPAGLTLSHLLARAGISNIVLDNRSREDIESTQRAGILEHGSVDVLVKAGVSDRVLSDGFRHDGIELRFEGEAHRIDFKDLVDRSVWLYPQPEVLKDLIARRLVDNGDIRFLVTNTQLSGVTGDEPIVSFTDEHGVDFEIHCELIAGADGSRGVSRWAIPDAERKDYFVEYPFAWFGILTDAKPSAPELIYATSDRGFALISQRTPEVQRMYFQTDPQTDVADWSSARIWDELQSRVAGGGFELTEGEITSTSVLPMRSYVCEPMQYGRLFLAGDAAHAVPPTGAKGLNLAISDVVVLAEAMRAYFDEKTRTLLDGYGTTALERVWKAQNFSWWMTTMMHQRPEATEFDRRRQIGELSGIVSSRAGSTYLAEGYTGWPLAAEIPDYR